MKICWAIVTGLIITEIWFKCYFIWLILSAYFRYQNDVQGSWLLQNKSDLKGVWFISSGISFDNQISHTKLQYKTLVKGWWIWQTKGEIGYKEWALYSDQNWLTLISWYSLALVIYCQAPATGMLKKPVFDLIRSRSVRRIMLKIDDFSLKSA